MKIIHSKKVFALFVSGSVLFIFATQIQGGWIEPLNRYTSFMVVHFLELWGYVPSANGTIITLNNFTVRIIGECTSLYILFLYSFFVLLSPTEKMNKLLGLLVGVPILDGLNSLRIAASVIIGAFHNHWFHFSHTFLTQVFSIAIVLLAGFTWLRYISRDTFCAPMWGFLGRFALLATLFSLTWIPLSRPFVFLLDTLLSEIFKIWPIYLHFTYQHEIYFQTFNLPVFIALILANSATPFRNRYKILLSGTGVLVFFHLLIRLQNVFMGVFRWDIMAFANGICLIAQYLLPLIFWSMTLQHFRLFQKSSDSLP